MAHPISAHELPPESDRVETSPTSSPIPNCCTPNSASSKNSPRCQCSNTFYNTGAYCREAQATLLLSEVIDHVNKSVGSLNLQKEVRETNFTRLDLELQSSLRLVIGQSLGTWTSYCGAINVNLSSV